ncbi:trypsin-like serine protease [Colwelliaceae bacterium 6441]
MSKLHLNKNFLAGAIAAFALTGTAQADLIDGSNFFDNSQAQAYIGAGNGDNSLGKRDNLDRFVDANVPTSDFTGVVKLQMQIQGSYYTCTGTAISQRHILSAAHCVDSNGQGTTMDISNGDQLLAIFNHDGDFNESPGNVIAAKNIAMHENYNGFNVCADGSAGCIGDDLAVIELTRDIPEGVEIYEIYDGFVSDTYSNSFGAGGDGALFTMVGYGTRGDGYTGFYTNGLTSDVSTQTEDRLLGLASYTEKLVGYNIVDLVGFDDEGEDFAELWYADFDGTYTDHDGLFGDAGESYVVDRFCGFGICSTILPENMEATIGGGDSGGPSFVWNALKGKYQIAATNTFGAPTSPIADGAFGHQFGGILLDPFKNWITAQIPAPATLMLFGLGLAGLASSRRKVK